MNEIKDIAHSMRYKIKCLLEKKFGLGYLLIYSQGKVSYQWFNFANGPEKPKHLPRELSIAEAYKLVTS